MKGCSTYANNAVPNPLGPGQYEKLDVKVFKRRGTVPEQGFFKKVETQEETRERRRLLHYDGALVTPNPGKYEIGTDFDGKSYTQNGHAGYALNKSPPERNPRRKCARARDWSNVLRVNKPTVLTDYVRHKCI